MSDQKRDFVKFVLGVSTLTSLIRTTYSLTSLTNLLILPKNFRLLSKYLVCQISHIEACYCQPIQLFSLLRSKNMINIVLPSVCTSRNWFSYALKTKFSTHSTLATIMASHDTWNVCQDHGKITVVCHGSYQGYYQDKNSMKPFPAIGRIPISLKASLCMCLPGITSKRFI